MVQYVMYEMGNYFLVMMWFRNKYDIFKDVNCVDVKLLFFC